ncbi:MAG: TIGR01212 family radical SAM protein [Thermodesulfobacteriota bacterium]
MPVSGECGCAVSGHPVHDFGRHYRSRYGEPVGKIALATGTVCPNRARGGCTYCAAASFTPYYLTEGGTVAAQLARGRHFLQQRKIRRYLAYFQQETPTAAPLPLLESSFRLALADPDCIGLAVSTRPDHLGDGVLGLLTELHQEFPEREFLVELGLQSAHDRTLAAINRNHDFADFRDAMAKLGRHPFIERGVHLILGLPGENEDDMRASVLQAVACGASYLKLHHLQVVRATELARRFAREPFPLPDAAAYLELLSRLLAVIPWRVVLHRLWSTAGADLLVAPRWRLGPAQLSALLREKMTATGSRQGIDTDE